jgi:dTDP-4-amino-4,6-dideoxygalactose transaminase
MQENSDTTTKYKYNPWPLGKIPKEFQRPELDRIKEMGYDWTDARDVIDIFEKKVAEFSGSKYAVAVDCCSHGIFLALKYLQYTGELSSYLRPNSHNSIVIPNLTYTSVPMQILNAGLLVEFEDEEWSGIYQLKGTRIWDGAGRFTKGMFVGGDALHILSYQLKKIIPIGKGGMILTNSEEDYKWLKLASYDGRDLTTPYTDNNHVKMLGYHMYMTPEDAARGIILMDNTPEINKDSQYSSLYLSLRDMFKNANILI